MLVRDRVRELRRVKASELRPNPRNWRTHPQTQQDSMCGMLTEIGYADALLARELQDGSLELIDGHLRAEITPEMEVPVLVLDFSDDEAAMLLALHDPLAGLAEANDDLLADLLTHVETQNHSLQRVLAQILSECENSLLDGADPSGFRPGMGAPASHIAHWRGADDFFKCPEDVQDILQGKSRLVVLFSGGKDSLSALLWVRRSYPDAECFALFCDTGVEFPGIGAYVSEVCACLQAGRVVVKPTTEWWSWLREKGRWPSLLYRECAQRMIHAPIARWIRANCEPKSTAVFTGSRAEEAVRGSRKTATSPLKSLGKDAARYFHYAPCFDVRKPTLERVLADSGVRIWPGYDRGFVRTACWCCPGQCGRQAAALQEHYPGLANEIRQWERRIGVLRPEDRGVGATFDDLVARGKRQRERHTARQQSL